MNRSMVVYIPFVSGGMAVWIYHRYHDESNFVTSISAKEWAFDLR
jgi:hypothetical protein